MAGGFITYENPLEFATLAPSPLGHSTLKGPTLVTSGPSPFMGQHHHLYNAAWRRARVQFLSAHPLCRMHAQLGQVVPANVVDHIKPHQGDIELFWDQGNWQPLCKQCHDAHKQAQESTGILRGAGLDGTPIDLAHPWHAQPPRGGSKVCNPRLQDQSPTSACNTAKWTGGVSA